MSSQKVRAGDGFVLRTPLLPVTALVEWAQAPDPQRYLMDLVARPEIREALYVASPSLYDALAAWLEAPAANHRVEAPIAKYVARMMGRATPFGLFSGVSVGKLGRETTLRLGPRAEYRRRTRIDNDYLFVLVAALAEQAEVRAKLTYRPSTSLYRVAGRWRYAEARLAGSDRSYHLVSVEPTPYLDATLERAAAGARYDELVAPLVADDITLDEAREYIDQLVAGQLLVPELGVYITGPEPIDGLLAQLREAGLDDPRRVLDDVRAKIHRIDASGIGNSPESYQTIERALEPLPGKVTRSRLFQVDMVKPAAATLSTRVAADVATTIDKLGQFRSGRGAMDEFKNAFRARWEDRTVPLLEALDEESGIGFEASKAPGAEGAPLLAGLPLGGGPPDLRAPWSRFEHHMLARLASALANGAEEIVLDDTDVEAMKLPTPAVLPDAFSVMVRIATAPDELMVEGGTNGPSGARILGRFCHASPEIDELVRAHHAAEEALRPDVVFAEVVHLNEGRIGNILCRPVMREHEVVYLGISGAPREKQITLDDLLVSVRGDRIVLTSRRLGKEVVPRLTTAHNYRLRSLGPYRFLCALATQDRDNAGWSWGVLGSMPFLPRIRIGRVIVSRAEWNLVKRDIEPITNAVRAANKTPSKRPEIATAVAALRDARKLPRMFVIAAADNELPIDLDNPLLVAAFADEVSGSEGVQLTELFPAPDRCVVSGPEGSFSNEIVLTFTRQPDKTAPASQPVVRAPAIQRSFAPGSEWLYAKIYCGSSTGDRVLCNLVGPVARAAIAAGDAREWFFIRYADPDPHIRVRFRGEPQRLCANVLPALERAYAQLAADGCVQKLVLDTYVRETERYGGDRGIDLVEQLFWRDSEAVLAIVELLDGDAGSVARWKLCVRGIDSMLEALGLAPEQRAKICAEGKESIGREMHAGTLTWSKIGEKFTKDRADLEVMFDRDPARDAAHDYEPGFQVLAQRDAAIRELAVELRRRDTAGELSPGIEGFAWSLVHMHANRLLHASQRAQEMVLYDFVRRLHAAKKARAR